MARANGEFYARTPPADTFRTAMASASAIAGGVLDLLAAVAEVAPPSAPLTVVDVGSGHGRLLTALRQRVSAHAPSWAPRLHCIGVDLRPRPESLRGIEWIQGDASTLALRDLVGVVLAHEFLDDLGVDVVRRTQHGPVLELVDSDGTTELEPLSLDDPRVAWSNSWWPDTERTECGLARDAAWARLVSMLSAGYAVGVDYGHTASSRPHHSSIVGWRNGHPTAPIPDGSVNVTADVAFDALADAGQRAAGRTAVLRWQHEVIERPSPVASADDARSRLLAIDAAARHAELTAVEGLGAHRWLVQPVGVAPSRP